MTTTSLTLRQPSVGPRAQTWVFLAAGMAVLAITLVMGFDVTRTGAAVTGELPLDQFLARHRNGTSTVLALAIEALLGVSVAPILVVVFAAVVGKVVGWLGGVVVLLVTTIGWGACAVGKVVVQRQRPAGNLVNALVPETAADSFPSGHTAFAAGLLASAVVVAYMYSRTLIPVLVLGIPGITAVATSRLYLGVHYLADVVGSCLVVAGTTLLLVGTYNAAWRLLQRWLVRRSVLVPADSVPEPTGDAAVRADQLPPGA